MAKIDGLKEEIGWLKLVFGTLVAIDASLIGWLAEHHATTSRSLLIIAVVGITVDSFAVARVNQLAYHRIEQLEDA